MSGSIARLHGMDHVIFTSQDVRLQRLVLPRTHHPGAVRRHRPRVRRRSRAAARQLRRALRRPRDGGARVRLPAFGTSDGEPRQLFDNKAQLADWRAAIACARQLGAWTPSASRCGAPPPRRPRRQARGGGPADRRGGGADAARGRLRPVAEARRCAEHQAPVGRPDGPDQRAARPRAAGDTGRGPAPQLAAATSPDALSGLARITPRPSTWRNETLARFTLATATYRPIRSARASAARCSCAWPTATDSCPPRPR